MCVCVCMKYVYTYVEGGFESMFVCVCAHEIAHDAAANPVCVCMCVCV